MLKKFKQLFKDIKCKFKCFSSCCVSNNIIKKKSTNNEI